MNSIAMSAAAYSRHALAKTLWISAFLLVFCGSGPVFSQTTNDPASAAAVAPASAAPEVEAQKQSDADLLQGEQDRLQRENLERQRLAEEAAKADANAPEMPKLEILDLIRKGGILMWPIGLLSVIGLMFALERFVALRRSAILPKKLFRDIDTFLAPGAFSPQDVWGICERYPSPSARVIQAMLLKAGRAMPEVEAAVAEAKQVEATSMYNNVRWLTLVASLAPLLGLLGTVVGMIQAFFITANMPVGGSRGELLAGGIYTALVTTAAGLVVAIPAAMIAHWYEGRIQNAFRTLDQRLVPLLEQVEKLENGQRFTLSDYKKAEK